MSGAAAGLLAGGPPQAAASSAASVQRGLRTAAAAASTAGSSNMGTVMASHHQQHQHRHLQQQQQCQQRVTLQPTAPAWYPQQKQLGRHHLPAAAAMGSGAAAAATAAAPTYFAYGVDRRPLSRRLQQRQYATGAAAQLATQEEEEEGVVAAGSLLEFDRGKEYLLGRAVKQTPQGWQVETASGTLYSVKATEIKYVLPGGAACTAADLAAVEAAAAAEVASDNGLLLLAWELGSGEGTPPIFTVLQMADLLFNSGDPASCAAALRLLRVDRLYFKQVGRSPPMFSPRTAAQVDSLTVSLRLQQEAEAEWATFASDIQQAQAQPRSSKPDEAAWRAGPHSARLVAVEGLALGTLPMSGPQRNLAIQTLIDLGKTPSGQDSAEVLQSIGWWPPHLNLNLITSGISEDFGGELEAAAASLLSSPPPDPDAAGRVDFTTTHSVITIDDATTTEIDDGLSLERLPGGGFKVWVHIADPSRWVDPASALASEAKGRCKSLYLPTGMIPMFPKCLAEGPFSLRQGVATEAVSVGVELTAEGAVAADGVEVVPSLVCPARRLTYANVDEMLLECEEEDEQDLFDLRTLSQLRRAYRMASGAVEIDMPESNVKVEGVSREDPDVKIEEENQFASPARQLVSEMMILAGEAVGELGRKLGVPLPYRGQPAPVLPEPQELAALPPGPCRAIALRSRMTRSTTATHAPLRHAGLGLEAYLQFTSPIRRYGDLLAHWQLKAALRGEQPPSTANELMDLMEQAGSTTQRLAKLEREVESYWVAEYFRQANKADANATWDAMFLCWLRQEVGLARVLLGGLGLETVLRINSPVDPGERVYVQCMHTDVAQGMYRLEVVPHAKVDQGSVRNSSSQYATLYSSANSYLASDSD